MYTQTTLKELGRLYLYNVYTCNRCNQGKRGHQFERDEEHESRGDMRELEGGDMCRVGERRGKMRSNVVMHKFLI